MVAAGAVTVMVLVVPGWVVVGGAPHGVATARTENANSAEENERGEIRPNMMVKMMLRLVSGLVSGVVRRE